MSEPAPVLVALVLTVLGLSYVFHTRRWLSLARRFIETPQNFFPAAIAMVAGGVALAIGYDRWTGTWPLFVTLLGWLLALEGAVILLLPALIHKAGRLSDRFLSSYLRAGGVFLLILGVLLLHALTNA